MKKRILATLALTSLVVSLVGPSVLAADVSGKTDTSVEFEAGGRPDPAKPEEGPNDPGKLEPDPVTRPELNNVFITHLPDISFGASNKVSLSTIEYKAEMEKRTTVADPSGTPAAEEFYMPHSAQVADLSGSKDTVWSLTVAQDDVYKSAANELKDTRIRIYEQSLTSSAYTNTDILTKVTGINFGGNNHVFIPVTTQDTTANPLPILDVTEAGSTNNSYTSAVFIKDYDEANYSNALTPPPAVGGTVSRYDGVRLNVPASDQAQKEAYEAALTWTMTVGP